MGHLLAFIPVLFSFFTQKTDSGFLVTVHVKVEQGWYVYAQTDSALQLDAIQITGFKSQNKAQGNIVFVQDKIFGKQLAVYNHDFDLTGTVKENKKLEIHGFASNGTEFLPVNEELRVIIPVSIKKEPAKNLWSIFLLGMIGGLVALFTPCVFPMVPETVSFFTHKGNPVKNGLLYGTCILLIYLLASAPFHLIGNLDPQILNSISTNAYINVGFFVVFIFFALSFFGLFEISLPSGVMNKVGSKTGAGMTGIFFMALTLATVSFSCTGPILGTLLVGSLSASGGAWQLTAGFAGFGLALSLPFSLFAMFPNLLSKLPKSGQWLDDFKKVLAFLELALAFKFLSNADLVMHWGLLNPPSLHCNLNTHRAVIVHLSFQKRYRHFIHLRFFIDGLSHVRPEKPRRHT